MVNFVTCWLRDPGDLPTDSGPPGGGGQGGGGDPGDGDDDSCDGQLIYHCCGDPKLNWDTVDDCIPTPLDRDTVTLGCTIPPPDIYQGCYLDENNGKQRCEDECVPEISVCTGVICDDASKECGDASIATDKELYDANACGQGVEPGCDLTFPCTYGADTYYANVAQCEGSDNECNDSSQTCQAWRCEEPGCGPDGGDCEQITLSKDQMNQCGWVVDPNDPNQGCEGSPGVDGESCILNNETVWEFKGGEQACKQSDECTLDLSCTKWTCNVEGTDSGTCTSSIVTENCEGDGSDCGAGVYNGPDGYGTEDECKQDPLCNPCPPGWYCDKSSGGDGTGTCLEGDEESCPGTYTSDGCTYSDGCFPDEPECEKSGCECKPFVGCGLALKNGNTDCITCDPIRYDKDNDKCIYQEEDDPTEYWIGEDGKGITKQEFFEGPYETWRFDKDGTGGSAKCEQWCKEGNDTCWACEDDTCWECVEKTIEGQRTATGKVCEEVPSEGDECVPQETGGITDGKDCILIQKADGDLRCIGLDGACKTKILCESDGLCVGASCPEYDEKSDCEALCSFGDFNPPAGFTLGGSTGFFRIYGDNLSNPVFQKDINNTRLKNNSKFLGVHRGTLRPDLFKEKVHIGIKACIDIINKTIPFSDKPFTDLSNRNIEKSLNDDLLLKLNTAILANGKPLRSIVIPALRDLIISNRLDEFNINDVLNTANTIINSQGKSEYLDTRSVFNLGALNQISNEAKAIELATKHIWPLASTSYDNRTSERMRYWKTLAPDLDKHLTVRTSDGNSFPFYYDINDEVAIDGSGTMTLSPGDLQRYTQSDGSIGEISIQSLIDRAGILNLETLQRIMALLGTTYDFKMTVTTDASSRIDERYGVTQERKNFYMLTLQTSSIEDLPRDNSFVAKTKSSYTYETSGPTRNQHVAAAPFPFLELYVDAQDPIFNYITNDGVIEIESKDFVFDIFRDTSSLPIIPRRGPVPTIVLYPTDRTSKVITHQISKHKSYGVREFIFNLDPNPEVSDIWSPVYLKESIAYPDRGISQTRGSTQDIAFSVNTAAINENWIYASGAPVLPRLKFGTRYTYSIAKELVDDYQIPSDNIVNWYEVYERMPIPMMKFMHKECSNFNNFESLLAMGKPSSDDSVNAMYPKLREVRSQNWLGNKDPEPNPVRTYLEVKPDHIPIPVDPLD
jgi:hypothetical protein